MIIDVDRIPSNGLTIVKDIEFSAGELVEENVIFLEPVHVEVEVSRTGEEVFIKGRMISRLSFVCCRCLLPFEFPVDCDFNLVFFPEELDVVKDQLENEDIDKLFYQPDGIDMDSVILEQLNLTLPLRPLCSKDCQGICPVCGKLLKEGSCSCTASEADHRLEKLKTFLRDKS
ncbi:MAG: DUF177 domain-containing protein [Candidatus Aminicenantes bacterium]|nr:DUF177 domain-containing protein [Candidatus Aminicenantes bacterium]